MHFEFIQFNKKGGIVNFMERFGIVGQHAMHVSFFIHAF